MSEYISSRKRSLNIGISSYTEKDLVLDVIGNANISGIASVGILSTKNINITGIATLTSISAGGTTGNSQYVLTSLGNSLLWQSVTSIPGVTGINVVEDFTSGLKYLAMQTGAGTTPSNTISSNQLVYNSTTTNLGIGTTNPTSKLTVQGNGLFTGVVTATTFYGTLDATNASNLKVAYATTAGIATNLQGGAGGSIPYQYSSGITSFLSNGNSGEILKSNGGTNAPSWASVSSLSIDYANTAGISSNVIGGIASVTSLSVSGISTLGTVQISSGIITSTTGVVTYYGDGSKLSGVSGTKIVPQDLISTPVYPVLANNAGVSSVGISTSGFNALVFIPSSGNLGIGTTNPTSKLHVVGDVKISGVITATTFIGNLTGTASTASFATTAFNLDATASSNLNVAYASNAGIATYATSAGIATYATSAGIATYATSAGIATYANTAGISTYATSSGIATYATNAGIATYAINAGIATNLQGGAGGSIPYQYSSGITSFLANGSPGELLQSNGTTLAPSWSSPQGLAIGYAATAGISSVALKLQTPRIISLSGDVVGSVSFDGSGDVSIASTIQPNSVGLGTDTTGDYVQSITGTGNQITVTGGTGEGSTPVLSIPNQFTAPQDVTVTRDLQVNRNLNVNGNITIGGTNAFINVQQLRVNDSDIVLGFRTDAFGNDVSNDTTANHGGIAVASTEGNPLVTIYNPGIGESTLPTYKKIMWFKAGTFVGQGTDAWLFNYAVGIGSTQFPSGTRLAAGNVQFTENDLAVVRNINSSGIITATKFVGNLVGIASTATNLAGGVTGNVPYQSNPGVTAFVNNPGVSGKVLLFNGTVPIWGDVSAASGSFGGISIQDESNNVGTSGNITTLNFVGNNISATATTGANGIATITVADYVSNAGIATYAINSGISTNVIGGIGSLTQLQVTGISTFTNGPVFIGSTISTGTTSQPLQVTGGAYVSGNLGIGTTNPTSKLTVVGNANFIGTSIGFGTSYPVEIRHYSENAIGGAYYVQTQPDPVQYFSISPPINNEILTIQQYQAPPAYTSPILKVFAGIGTTTRVELYEDLYLSNDLITSGNITATSNMEVSSNLLKLTSGVGTVFFSNNTPANRPLIIDPDYTQSYFRINSSTVGFGSTTNLSSNFTFDTLFEVNANGNIGIGTSLPTSKLEVVGELRIVSAGATEGEKINIKHYRDISYRQSLGVGATNNKGALSFEGTSSFAGIGTTMSIPVSLFTITNDVSENVFSVSGYKYFSGSRDSALDVTSSGRLGIGITNPVTDFQINRQAYFSQNIGVNTVSAGATVDIRGDLLVTGASASSTEYIKLKPQTIGINTFVPTRGGISYEGDLDSTASSGGQLLTILNDNTSLFAVTKFAGLSSTRLAPAGQRNIDTVFQITSGGNVGVGTTNPLYTFSVTGSNAVTSSGLTNVLADFTANINSFSQINTRNASNGDNASSDIIATADTGTNSTNYIDLGINNSGFNSPISWTINGALDGYLYTSDTNLSIGAASNKYVSIFTGGTLAANERLRVTGTGSVGIGTTNPQAILDVSGDALISGLTIGKGTGSVSTNIALGYQALKTNTTGSNNTATGYQALFSNTTGYSNTATGLQALYSNIGIENTATGLQALRFNTTGGRNTANGHSALYSNTTASTNTANGYKALYSNTTAISNTANGYKALQANTTGSNNTATGVNALISNTTGGFNTANGVNALSSNTIGSQNIATGPLALYSNTTGSNNVATGYQALYLNITGINNVANGYNALRANTTGNNNTATGGYALFSNTTGSTNTATGVSALYSNTTGSNNTATGLNALFSNTTGSTNTATGYQTLRSNTTGGSNTANGLEALYSNTTGNNNTANGLNAGYNLTTGSNNSFLGYNSQPSAVSVSNEITLGDTNVDTLRVPGLGFYGVRTNTTVATTSTTTIDSIVVATYRSARIQIQITQGTNYQVSDVLLIHDGTTASIIEYGTLATGSTLGTYSATISGGNALLQVSMGSATSSAVKVLSYRTVV